MHSLFIYLFFISCVLLSLLLNLFSRALSDRLELKFLIFFSLSILPAEKINNQQQQNKAKLIIKTMRERERKTKLTKVEVREMGFS